MDNNIQKIICDFFNTGNVGFSSGELIRLDEVTESVFFVDVNGILSYPGSRERISELLYRTVSESGLKPDIIAGADHSGIPFTVLLSIKGGFPVVYIRNSSKKHGKQNKTEGVISGGEKALIFTDYYSSPAKIDFALKALSDENVSVCGIVTVFNYTDDEKYNGIGIYSLFDYRDFITIGSEKGYIDSFHMRLLETGNKMPDIAAPDQEMAEKGAEILLDIKAVSLSVAKPFRYASGILSPVYCDNRLLISYPDKWEKIIDYMINIIESKIGLDSFDIIGGTSTAGIPHSSRIAEKLKKPLIYIKSEKGSTGKQSEIEGNLVSGRRVLIIEDLISTGGSSIKAVQKVRDKNGIVDFCLAIFTYEMKSGEDLFRENSCTLYTVSTFSKLIKTALSENYINQDEMEKALDWNSDPVKWGEKYGYEK